MGIDYKKILRFGVVGTSGFVVDFSATWLLLSVAGVNEFVANAAGFTLGATNNYVWNRRWTWRSTNPNVRWEYLKFLAVSLAGLAINSAVIWLFVNAIDLSVAGLSSFWVGKLVATGVVMVWNFAVNNLFTFRA